MKPTVRFKFFFIYLDFNVYVSSYQSSIIDMKIEKHEIWNLGKANLDRIPTVVIVKRKMED